MAQYPRMFKIRQNFPSSRLEELERAVKSELSQPGFLKKITQGESVAVTAGSRGISNIHRITKAVIDFLKEAGARPFIVPAMGSHGGATAQGQLKVLARYGITEEAMGVPIKSSMKVVEIGKSPLGLPVYIDEEASRAHHIVLINRIKPHTRFTGRIESGILKMLLVGLGKHEGASMYHRAVMEYSFDEIVKKTTSVALKNLSIPFGLAIIENALGEVAELKAMGAGDFLRIEPKLLQKAFNLMAKLPFNEADLLIIDEIGKNISGTGLDTTIVGRKGSPQAERVRIKRIFVRDLTTESDGNACGIGLSDFANRRLVKKINFNDTYVNCIAGQRPEGARLPLICDTDREAIDHALATIGLVEPARAKVMWIKNTRDLRELRVSEAYLDGLHSRKDLEIISQEEEMTFNPDGEII